MKAKAKTKTPAPVTVLREGQVVPTAQTRKAFLAAVKANDLATQVRIARQVARDRIWVSDGWSTEHLDVVSDLVGGFPEHNRSAEAWDAWCHGIAAAFALGVAIGQLLHPDVFTMGGAK